MLASMDVVPGQGIDFTALGQVLMLALVVYAASSVFSLFQFRLITTVVQRTVYRLREQVEAKLSRLPLSYFDKQARGEVLSRATNDIDNVAQTLQQTLSQLINSVLTIIGVLAMMFWISPLLALIALVTVPRVGLRDDADRQAGAAAVRRAVGHHRQAQRAHRGDVHRALAGEGLRAAEGGRRDVQRAQRGAVRVELQGAVHLRDDPARDVLHRQPELRAGRGRRRAAGGRRARCRSATCRRSSSTRASSASR